MTKEAQKITTPMTDKKKVEIVNIPVTNNNEWVFKGQLKRNGKLYANASVCPKEKIEEMKKLGFIEKA